MNRKTLFSGSLLAAASSLTLSAALAIPAYAQEQTATFDIPAQPLSEALVDFSRQAGVNAFARSGTTNGYTSAPVSGTMSAAAALNQLIGDAPVEIRAQADGSFEVAQATAQAEPQPEQATGIGGLFESGGSAVTGQVRGSVTGSNLKGARVELVETGQIVATDDLGRFRITGVAPGDYTLRISYLGREPVQERITVSAGEDFAQSFEMGFGAAVVMSEVEVFGSRSSRAQAINQERTAENSQTVISDDLLGNFTGTTISESLRRAPGVAFEQDFDTGDGTNIILRGLAPDLNTVTFNGVELPVGDGVGRSADLSSLLAGSVSSVTINKSLLPNQDSAGIGGLVEIETKTPLDRPSRFAQFSIQGRERGDDFSEDTVASAILSGKFGAGENVGLGVSLQYRDREIRSVGGGYGGLVFGAYLPLDSEGGTAIRSETDVTPGNPFPFFDTPGGRQVFPESLFLDDRITETENLSIGLNGAWDIGGHTSLRLDLQRIEQDSLAFFSNYSFATNLAAYSVRPVAEQDGDELRALGSSFFFPLVDVEAGYRETESATDVISFSGESFRDRFTFNYGAGFTQGSQETPDSYRFRGSDFIFDPSVDWFTDGAIDPVEGIVLSPFAALTPENEGISGPLFTAGAFDRLNGPAAYRYPSSSTRGLSEGENERFVADFSVRYDAELAWLNYVEVGVDYEQSEFSSQNSGFTITRSDSGLTFDQLGIAFDSEVLSDVGISTGLFAPSVGEARQFLGSLDSLIQDGTLVSTPQFLNNPIEGVNVGTRAKETEFAPYFQASASFGDFELIGGFRYTDFEIESSDLDLPTFVLPSDATQEQIDAAEAFREANSVFRTEVADQQRLLPRFQLNYRPNEKLVFRGSYGQAIARPQLGLISSRRQFGLDLRPLFGPDLTPQLTIIEGNEDLDPALTDSFDLSAEWYDDRVGVIKLSGFYKRIENLTELNDSQGSELLDGVVLPDYPDSLVPFDIRAAAEAGDLFVVRQNPLNNDEPANIWGIELALERQFVELPGWWSGFGFYGNYTYTESEKEQPFSFRDPVSREDVPFVFSNIDFNGQPNHSGTAAVTYNANNIDASLIYSAQSRRQSNFRPNGLSNFEEGFESLDFRFVYLLEKWGGQYQLSFEATDLMRDVEDPTLLRGTGEDTIYYTNRSYLGGREFRLGLTATF